MCVVRNLTIILINSNNSSPLTKLDVFGIISSTNWSKEIPYKVSSKLILPFPGIAELCDSKNKKSLANAPYVVGSLR